MMLYTEDDGEWLMVDGLMMKTMFSFQPRLIRAEVSSPPSPMRDAEADRASGRPAVAETISH